MPPERRRSSRNQERITSEDATRPTSMRLNGAEITQTPSSPKLESSLLTSPVGALPDSVAFRFKQDQPEPQRVSHSRKKPVNHIPRPPNAFILFRSMFIKSRHVSTEVETNHSTLSKIIGMTWQNLPDEERQKWHVKAKHALDEHKRQFPQYSFKPVHNRAKTAERKKIREVGPKDHKRCEKIAELLVSGAKGQELEAAIHEFDKHHVPEVVTRFDTPITASTFSPTSCSSTELELTPEAPSKRPSSSHRNHARRTPPRPSITIPCSPKHETYEAPPAIPFYRDSLFPNPQPSFDYDTFAFSISQPSPSMSHGDDYTQDVSPMDHSFEPKTSQNPSMLCTHSEYRGVEEWTRQSSPLSNSTSSMPSTPSHLNIPFPEPYSTFTPEAASDYASLDAPYTHYSNYSYAPMPDSTYQIKGSENSPSGFHSFPPEAVQQAPMLRDDMDFSSLMDSLTSYSL